ncbi:hypothetical protein [Streptomyces sp. NPDC059906]|uniref:hypothetical protein n=1 Tax=Streptomyces sp. NPDC059906 TaxID=3346997 RepID=UPI003651F4D7
MFISYAHVSLCPRARERPVDKVAATERSHTKQETLPIPPWEDRPLTSAKKLSPKRPAVEKAGLADVFPYYAGFAFEWAQSRLTSLDLEKSAVVLDPWNGSGTTTLAAQTAGFHSVGIDLNPVANKVAYLRTSLLAGDSVAHPPPPISSHGPLSSDALLAWFHESTVRRIRDWTESFSSVRVEQSALGYVALFRVIRRLSRKFEGSNPTWVKRARNPEDLIKIKPNEIDDAISKEQLFVADRLTTAPVRAKPSLLLTASAMEIPLLDNSVDAVLTSPPYLTRIDYAVAYARELAILGIDIDSDRSLRRALMGTTLTRPTQVETYDHLSEVSRDLLKKVAGHESKASSSYYLKQARQYLCDLARGLQEITRVSKPGAHMMLVVQDSYYKDIPVPLAEICIAESRLRGWELVGREAFPVKRTLTAVNTPARAYKKGEVAETVVKFRSVRNG